MEKQRSGGLLMDHPQFDSSANIISVSGGKDSTALLLLAIERETPNLQAVFADTGHEHAQTYEYLDYLEDATGVPIRRVRANFRAQIAKKRETVVEKWAKDGVPQERIDRALELLVPTGIPMLDLCLWKGRFPSTRARFCSEELKHHPIQNQVQLPAIREFGACISWQGVRADESRQRARLVEWEETDPPGLWNYRPILTWTADDCFAMHRKHGIRHNPLYEQGMGRVGCMPCIHSRKAEIAEIARRFPEEVARVALWERLVSGASKRGASTWFDLRPLIDMEKYDVNDVSPEAHGIGLAVEWSKTTRGGRQYDLIASAHEDEAPSCSSIYGLCE